LLPDSRAELWQKHSKQTLATVQIFGDNSNKSKFDSGRN
jgi:hypothetical protein